MDRAALGQRAAGEFKELLALAAYLYVSLCALLLPNSGDPPGRRKKLPNMGHAEAKAFILAKFMLLARTLPLGLAVS